MAKKVTKIETKEGGEEVIAARVTDDTVTINGHLLRKNQWVVGSEEAINEQRDNGVGLEVIDGSGAPEGAIDIGVPHEVLP